MSDTGVAWLGHGFGPAAAADQWTPALFWTHLTADIVIGLAFLAIPLVLATLRRRRRDLPFGVLYWSFTVLISASGLAHLVSAWSLCHAQPGLEGFLKAITAAAAIPTAIILWRYLPKILAVPSQAQLRAANAALERTNNELEAFTASVSHDLRAPLTTIAGQAGLLELSMGKAATEDQKKRLNRIHNAVRQTSELIEALLVLSRISRHTLYREEIDLTQLCDGVISDLRQKDPDRQIGINIQPGMLVHGDRRLVTDLMFNVLNNAWKFTSKTAAPQIDVTATEGETFTTVRVRDNGAGFDMNYAARLFKPFHRLHTNAEFPGSGVGLATVARIVDRHGGRIWAEARVNQGATFFFTLPVAPITVDVPVAPNK
jgi:signal transduction histidine kinase